MGTNAATAEPLAAPPLSSCTCGTMGPSAVWKQPPFAFARRIACRWAQSRLRHHMSAVPLHIKTCRRAAGAAGALLVTDAVRSCSTEAASVTVSVAAAAVPAHLASNLTSPALRAGFCTGPPAAVVPHFAAASDVLTAGAGVPFAAASLTLSQGRQVFPLVDLTYPPPVAGHQRWFQGFSPSQKLNLILRCVDERQEPHNEEQQWRDDQPYQDLLHAGKQQQQQHHKRHPRQQQHQLHRRDQPQGDARTRQGQPVVQEPWWHGWPVPQYASRVLRPGQELQQRYLRQQQRQQHESQQHSSGQHQPSFERQHGAEELQHHRPKKQQLSRRSRRGAQVRSACSSPALQAHCTPSPVPCSLGDPRSRLVLLFRVSNSFPRAAPVCCFSSSSGPLTHELERRLLQEENTGMGTTTVYDRRRQGVILAIADDVLLVRGLAAAPVGTLVTFTLAGAGQPSATATTAAAGDVQRTRAAAEVASGAAAAGEAAAAGRVAEPNKGVGGTREAGGEEEPAPVLGVVLQLLQQDLNIVGLLGGSSNLSSSTGECLPFRAPCVGDLCAAVSAYEHQSSQLQQRAPEQDRQSQRQSRQDTGGDQSRVQKEYRQQQEGSQRERPQSKPYELIDLFLPACSGRVASPLALLRRVVPATATADQALDALGVKTFFNVLDFSQPSAPTTCPRTGVKLPWGLPTGSAAVDALAPLQVGETSAFLGPPGTGKTQALVPAVALHAAATAAAAIADAAPAVAGRPLPTAAREASPVTTQSTKTTSQQKLSVVFLSLGSSPSALRQWLDAVSRETAVCSAPVSAPTAAGDTAHAGDTMTAGMCGGQTDPRSSSGLWSKWTSPPVAAADTIAASAKPGAPAASATSSTAVVPSALKSIAVLHVPTPGVATPAAAAGASAETTSLRGHPSHPTSTLMYMAPVLALRLALEAQAAAATHGTSFPVLLVIDGLAMHPSAVEQLQLNIQKLLCSHSAGVHLPAGIAGLAPPAPTVPLPPGAAAGYSAAAAAAVALPVALPFSATSLYGMLSCKTSRAAGANIPLSLLLVLDTPSDPAVLTARNLQRSASSLVQTQRIEKTLLQAVKGDDSVGAVLSQKAAREVQEALLSAAERTILFARGTQQQGQRQSVAQAAHEAVQRDQQQQRQQQMRVGTEAGRRGKLLLDRIYPMIDIDSVVATSTATLSADACTALSQSCFSQRDSPTAEENGASLEALRDALKALCRRQQRAEKQLLKSTLSSMIPGGAHVMAHTSQGTTVGMKASKGTGQLLFEPPALLAAAAAAFAWQRRVLHSESERQQLMQQFRLFVDVWEEEDVDSLAIASAICLARPVGRIFSPSEQLVLLRAAATLFFTPTRVPAASGGERERGTAPGCPAPSSVAGGGAAAPSPQRGFLSFAQICAFQEDLLELFREKEPRLWEAVQQHLQRAREWPLQLHCDVLETTNTKEGTVTRSLPTEEEKSLETGCFRTAADEEEQVEHMAQHIMRLISRVDTALLNMRSYFGITAPCFQED